MVRDRIIDIAKGLAILCVVLGHVRVGGSYEDMPKYVRFVSQFHVPLFFFVSGLFFNRDECWNTFFSKKLKRLWLPFVVANIIFLAIHIFETLISGYDVVWLDMIKHAIKVCLMLTTTAPWGGPTWFLPILLLAFVIYKFLWLLVRPISQEEVKESIIVILATLAFFVGVFANMPLGINRAFFAVFYLAAGNFFFKRGLYEKFRKSSIRSLFIVLTITAVAECLFAKYNLLDVYSCHYGNLYICAFSSIAGIIMIFAFSILLDKCCNYLSRFFSYAGEKSIWILIGHSLSFYVFSAVLMLVKGLSFEKGIEVFPIGRSETCMGGYNSLLDSGLSYCGLCLAITCCKN